MMSSCSAKVRTVRIGIDLCIDPTTLPCMQKWYRTVAGFVNEEEQQKEEPGERSGRTTRRRTVRKIGRATSALPIEVLITEVY